MGLGFWGYGSWFFWGFGAVNRFKVSGFRALGFMQGLARSIKLKGLMGFAGFWAVKPFVAVTSGR